MTLRMHVMFSTLRTISISLACSRAAWALGLVFLTATVVDVIG